MSHKPEIVLYGELRAKFGHLLPNGRSIKMDVNTPREAARALCSVIPGFRKHMMDSHLRGITYAVFKDKRNIDKDELDMNTKCQQIRIAPVIQGNKNSGLFQTILGAVLVVVGVVVGVMTGWTGVGAQVGIGIAMAGASMMIGGVVQMLSPQASGLRQKEDADNAASYAFGSPVNTTSQGYPVPVLYGKREVGGAIISAGMYAADQQ